MTSQDYSPDKQGAPPSQWTHFKSRKESHHRSNHSKNSAHHTRNPHQPANEGESDHQPIYFSSPGQHKRKKFSANAPFLIIFVSLGIILVAVGMYLFRNQVAEQVSQIADNISLQSVTNTDLTKKDLVNSILLSADGYLHQFNLNTNQLSVLDKYTTQIPGDVYAVKPNQDSDIFLIASSKQEATGQTNYYFILNLQTSQLLNITPASLKQVGGSSSIDNSVWNEAGNELLISTIVAEDEQDIRQYRLSTVDPTNAKLTQVGEVSAHRFEPFYFEDQMVAADLTQRTETANQSPSEDYGVDPTVTITEEIVEFNLDTQAVNTIETDANYRLSSAGGNFYITKNNDTLIFRPFDRSSSQGLAVDLEPDVTPLSVNWLPDGQSFVLATRDANEQTQFSFYSTTGEELFSVPAESGSSLLITSEGSVMIGEKSAPSTNNEAGQSETSVVLKEIDPESGQVIATHSFAALQPALWAWVK